MLNEDSSPLHDAFTFGQGSPLPSNAEGEMHHQVTVNEWPHLQRRVEHRVSARSLQSDLGRGRDDARAGAVACHASTERPGRLTDKISGLLAQPIPARG